jgi:hypothetical protein
MNWPWTRPQPTNQALIERLEALERKIKALSTDWDETYEKFQRLNARMAQRWRRLSRAEDEAGDEDQPAAARNGADTPTNPLALELLRGRQ